ncbi:MAG: hypothetical protein OXC91_04395 [Rhodobacteraceae bacterium]|nr:hypothetical protein [Paracoccaceae bacterium]
MTNTHCNHSDDLLQIMPAITIGVESFQRLIGCQSGAGRCANGTESIVKWFR